MFRSYDRERARAKPVNRLTDIIRNAIRTHGPISFFDFMALALYAPSEGYYEKMGRVGRSGDFYTSVSVGPLFGELLAWQFREWLSELEAELSTAEAPVLQLVEVGANDGRLAADIARAWVTLPGGRPVELVLVESSPRRREWQEATLAGVGGLEVRWVESLEALGSVQGVIFSNELLDSLPVHRMGWDRDRRTWFEWGVEEVGESFGWVRLSEEAAAEALADPHLLIPAELAEVLPDGFRTEVHSTAKNWWTEASRALNKGWLLAFDYGMASEEFYSPQRAEGTLRAYNRHRVGGDLLGQPGQQDLTAHVNFTACQQAGEAEGLGTVGCESQATFLTGVAGLLWSDPNWIQWTSSQVGQFKTLTHPEHLGRPFRVLVQMRR
jgi:SAM-dependent MidA family methyltransferase